MIKKTVTYTDFNGETVSEDFYFHMSKAELVELEMRHEGGLKATLERIIKTRDGATLIDEFKQIILGAYGEKSMDGRRFVKNQKLREEFEASEAYSTLFMELIQDTAALIEFINGIVPQDMSEAVARAAGINPKVTPLMVVETEEKPAPRVVTKEEVVRMNSEEIAKLGEELAAGTAIVKDPVFSRNDPAQ